MKSNFLYLDDNINRDTVYPLTTLTGLLVPCEKYEKIRQAFYEAIHSQIFIKENTIRSNPLELHFNDFLPALPDNEKYIILICLS